MFKLKELTTDTITADETKKCQILFDWILAHEEQRLGYHSMSDKQKEESLLMDRMVRDRESIKKHSSNLLFALNTLVQTVNSHWDIKNQGKLMKKIIDTDNDQLISFTLDEKAKLISFTLDEKAKSQEHQQLARSFTDYIQKRDNSKLTYKKLKKSISI